MTARLKDDRPSVWAGWEALERATDRCCAPGTPRSEDTPPAVFAKLPGEPGCSCSQGAAEVVRALPTPAQEDGPPRLPQPGGRPNRVVSGDWLARQLELDPDEAQAIAGRQVEVEPEAWLALRALRSSATRGAAVRARVDRRRATAFPREAKKKGGKADGDGRTGALPFDPSWFPYGGGEEAYTAACATYSATTFARARFVHAADGDDDASGALTITRTAIPGVPGGLLVLTVSPWKTLARVETWLSTANSADGVEGVYGDNPVGSATCVRGARVFFRRGERWTWGGEILVRDWLSAGFVALTVSDFKATERSPLTLAAYGSGDPPRIDGSTDLTGASTEPQYGDDRIGFAFNNCCHVYVSGIDIRGFRIAIDIEGASKDHLYESLTIYDNATYGIRFGVRQEAVLDEATGEPSESMLEAVVAAGAYPENIRVVDSAFRSNGYDTEGADVAIDFLSTSCTISNNTMEGDDVRGIDGVVSQGGSSGHDIDSNTISRHAKYCYGSESDKTVLAPASVLGAVVGTCADVTLVHSCAKDTDFTTDCGTATGYGYNQYYYGGTTTSTIIDDIKTADTGDEVQEAFGEDGIDLKGVRDRTGDGDAQTVVRNNIIFGHPNHSGITINDGTQGVHIYNNRIYANGVGILVTNDTNQGAWYVLDSAGGIPVTQDIKIYRNPVTMNTQQGIKVQSQILDVPSEGATSADGYTHQVSGVYIVNNTIAHNFYAGLQVALGDYEQDYGTYTVSFDGSDGDVSNVFVYNNLFARNGIGAVDDSDEEIEDEDLKTAWKSGDAMQVAWDGKILLAKSVGEETIASNYNAYLGWEHRTLSASKLKVAVIRCSDAETVENAESVWSIETDGVQADYLEDLDLAGESVLSAASDGLEASNGHELYLLLLDGASGGDLDPLISAAASYVSAYDIANTATSDSSKLINAGTTDTKVDHFASTSSAGDDVALNPDIDDQPIVDEVPDIGAFEGPDTPLTTAKLSLRAWFGDV